MLDQSYAKGGVAPQIHGSGPANYQRRVAMKKLIVSLFALALMCTVSALAQDTMKSDSGKSAKATKINGWVSDSKCGAAGAKAGHADCAKKCLDAGEKIVFVSDKD